jgi:hypothetical protein
MFASRIKPVIPPQPSPEDVQVEVCLDSKDTLFSIMVQSQAALQSVMAVPKQDAPTGSRSRHLKQHRYSQANGTPVAIGRDQDDSSTSSYRRQMDLMRNLSPIKNDRSSLFSGSKGTDDNYQHYNRRNVQSLPPQTRRSQFENETIANREKRDSSCIPAFHRGDVTGLQTSPTKDTNNRSATRSIKNSSTSSKNQSSRPAPIAISSKSNKPDLVSVAASRGGFFRTFRPSARKVQDSSI